MTVGRAILGFFSFLWRVLDGLRKVLHLIVLLVLFIIVLAALSTAIPFVPHRAALVLNPHGRIVEQLSGNPLDRAVGRATAGVEAETRLRDVLDVLTAAAKDKRIRLVVLDLGEMAGGGLSKMQEIGAALVEFRKSGKKVIAVGDSYDQEQFYLAAHADEVYLDPFGVVFVTGFEYFRMYLREALDKLAVQIHVFKVGTYKSYTETFTRNDMSPENREESLAWLSVLWDAYQRDVTKARGLPEGALAAYVNDAPALVKGARGDSAKVALAQGLVTALKTREQIGEELETVVGQDETTHSFNSVEFERYLAAVRSEEVLKGDPSMQVGVIVASGEILDGEQPPGTIGGESTAALIRDARFDEDIKAIVVRVDSPGGSMYASEQIYRELQALRAAGKPVVVSMSSTAASGGYYIAAAADEIWAAPTTITGSIGVFAAIPTFQGTLDKIGVNVDGVGTTELSGEFRLDRGLGPDAQAILQASVEHAYREFLDRVARRRAKRPMTPKEVESVAQGRVWAAPDAHRRGLVDQLGNLEQAIASAGKRAKLGPDYGIRYLDPEVTWQQALAMQFRSTVAAAARAVGWESRTPGLLRKVLSPLEREIARLMRLNDPRDLYSYCFCEI